MLEFQVPVKQVSESDTGDFFRFSITGEAVLFAGSRHRSLSHQTCRLFVEAFGSLDKSFMVGCASGVDRSFRYALSLSSYRDRVFVACAFDNRLDRGYGLHISVVVPQGLTTRVSLRRRTLWMIKRCSMAVIFPDDPLSCTWGKGSSLVFRACLDQIKPVFVVTRHRPKESDFYHLLPTSLFGIVSGYFVVPHPVAGSGTCDDPM